MISEIKLIQNDAMPIRIFSKIRTNVLIIKYNKPDLSICFKSISRWEFNLMAPCDCVNGYLSMFLVDGA